MAGVQAPATTPHSRNPGLVQVPRGAPLAPHRVGTCWSNASESSALTQQLSQPRLQALQRGDLKSHFKRCMEWTHGCL